jgi:hypothetical protein
MPAGTYRVPVFFWVANLFKRTTLTIAAVKAPHLAYKLEAAGWSTVINIKSGSSTVPFMIPAFVGTGVLGILV